MHDDLTLHAKKVAPEYGEHDFSDHLPMAVTALRAMGAEESRVSEFAKGYSKQLKRKKLGSSTIDPMLLSVSLGDNEVYPKALNFFLNEIESSGRAQVLAEYVPELTKGIASAAFHGVIRTAYGLIADENLEIAAGLAYWWAHWAPISPGSSIGAANDKPATLMEDIASAFRKHGKKVTLDQPTISARIAAVRAQPAMSAVLAKAMSANVSFEEIAGTALQIYLAAEDFTALHCVTGVHATRVLIEHVVMDDVDLRGALWASLCAAYASIGAPTLEPLAPPPSKAVDWRVLTAAAIAADDAHDIKFVYSCQEEARHYGRDMQYRYAAGVRLGMN